MRFLFLLFLLTVNKVSLATNLENLFVNADVVISGNITNISGSISDDLGTNEYIVNISVDSIYKQNFYIDVKEIKIQWEISNLICKKNDLKECITQHKNGKKIFFLNQTHFHGGSALPDSQIIDFNFKNETDIVKINSEHQLTVNYFYRNKTCGYNCDFCNNIKNKNWKKVECYIKQQSHLHNAGWIKHKNVKWVLPDRAVLASLPTHFGERILFITDTGELEAYTNYQLGYYKTYSSWIPRIINKLWNKQVYKYFSVEDINYVELKVFKINTNYSREYLHYEYENYLRQIYDSAEQNNFGAFMQIPDEYILLSSAFDGEMKLYQDYKTLPDYVSRAKTYIDTLMVHKNIYLLCFLTNHSNPEIGVNALQALRNINDVSCVPFLIELAKHKSKNTIYDDENYKIYETYLYELIQTLDFITQCKTNPQSVPYGVSANSFDISLSIPLWLKKIKMYSRN